MYILLKKYLYIYYLNIYRAHNEMLIYMSYLKDCMYFVICVLMIFRMLIELFTVYVLIYFILVILFRTRIF